LGREAILLTGGAGYIGSHVALDLLAADRDVFIVDNLCNSKASVLERIGRIAGRTPQFAELDVRDGPALRKLFAGQRFDAVVHCAGLKAVGESMRMPLAYYDNNVAGSRVLAQCMAEAGVKTLVFSSSATVYGNPARVPIREDFPLDPVNPYGRTKLMVEQMLRDVAASDAQWGVALLRYFNPVGAHPSATIGEDPNGVPNNLMPYIAQVAAGKLQELSVFGADYPTPDGTGVRDYLHVADLARGHTAALEALRGRPGVRTVNLGTGRGHSVFEVIRAFERASGRRIPYRVVARREGDIATCYADPSLAADLLGWRAEKSIDQMCADSWRWQQWADAHPDLR
jgi:UDP-glucose 4-epimerase